MQIVERSFRIIEPSRKPLHILDYLGNMMKIKAKYMKLIDKAINMIRNINEHPGIRVHLGIAGKTFKNPKQFSYILPVLFIHFVDIPSHPHSIF